MGIYGVDESVLNCSLTSCNVYSPMEESKYKPMLFIHPTIITDSNTLTAVIPDSFSPLSQIIADVFTSLVLRSSSSKSSNPER